jgi:hypothetical protein
MEARDTGGEYIRWGEVYSVPSEIVTNGLYNFPVDTLLGPETITYNPVGDILTGNFTKDRRTLLLEGASITLIDINRTYMKGLMVPSDVPLHTRALFHIFINLQEDYQCSVTVNGIAVEWDNLGMMGSMLVIGLSFNSSGMNDVGVNINTTEHSYTLGWDVNVG